MRIDIVTLDDVLPALVRLIEHLVRMSVAGEESLQPHDIGIVRRADDHRADPLFHEADAAKDQRAHHVLADLGLFDHHVADARRGNGQRIDVALRDKVHERRAARTVGRARP